MLLPNTPLTEAAKRHFNLPRSPFINDVQSRADVYHGPAMRYARAALADAAQHGGFIGIIGESGAGKTTMVQEFEERIKDDGRDIKVIKPWVLGMEASDTRGKTLKSAAIAESIIRALDPAATIMRTQEARFNQTFNLLKAGYRAGCRHLLVIEEAHCLPIPTLKHLKRFIEMRDGLRTILSVALVAQPELRALLHSQNPEIREVMQRCELVDLAPLDAELEQYLTHKLARFDIKPEQVFERDAFDALRARLIRTPRGGRPVSTCYPLAVHNLVARAMNAAAAAGWPKVDAACVEGC